MAILGFGLSTDIKAGENKGELLQHDFVVLALKEYQIKNGQWQGELPQVKNEFSKDRKAVIAWLTSEDSIKPIQAVASWIP